MLELYSLKKPFRYLWSLKKPTLLHPTHVHVTMKRGLAVQNEEEGDGTVKIACYGFRDMSITARGSVRQLRGHCCPKGAALGEYPAHPLAELGAGRPAGPGECLRQLLQGW